MFLLAVLASSDSNYRMAGPARQQGIADSTGSILKPQLRSHSSGTFDFKLGKCHENVLDEIPAVSHDVEMTTNNSNVPLGDVKEKVRAFVLEYAADRGVTAVTDDEPILTNNIIDSLGSLRMVDFLETAFPLTIEDTDMLPENFQTINDVEIFINRKLGIGANGSENDAEVPNVPALPLAELITN